MNCGVCQQFTNSVVIYCFAGNLGTDKTSRDLKTGTTHWVCKDCYESMKGNGTSGTCPYCRASNAGVSIYKQKAAVRAVYEFVDQE